VRFDHWRELRLLGYRCAASTYAAFAIGLLAALRYLRWWRPERPPGVFWGLDSGSYYRMAQHPFHSEHFPFVLRPAVPLLVRLIPLPTAWQFALMNLILLGVLCVLVERIAARLGRPPVVGVAAAAVVCACNPVWKAFLMRAMVDLPVLCLIAGVVLLALSDRLRVAWSMVAASALAHPLGLLMSAGALIGRSWRAGLSAGFVGAGMYGTYALLMHPHVLPVAPDIAVGFKASIAHNEPGLGRAIAAALIHGIGPLAMAYWRAPAGYRRIIVPMTVGVLIATTGASDWTRMLGYLCPVLIVVALPSPSTTPLRSGTWREFAWPITSAAALMLLFLWPILSSVVLTLRIRGLNLAIRDLVFLQCAVQMVPWHRIQRPALAIRRPIQNAG
jgi:hypothetical protein